MKNTPQTVELFDLYFVSPGGRVQKVGSPLRRDEIPRENTHGFAIPVGSSRVRSDIRRHTGSTLRQMALVAPFAPYSANEIREELALRKDLAKKLAAGEGFAPEFQNRPLD